MENQLNLFSLDKGQGTRDKRQQTTGNKQLDADQGPNDNSKLNPQSSILYQSLEEAKSAAMSCKKCKLCEGRTNVVFSDGVENAKIMIIGEGPGENEDLQGLPFVGKAGKLLDKIFESVGLTRKEHLYICNIVKCRPPSNRAPEEDEANACSEYLKAQIKYTDPKIIILAGAVAVKGILKKKDVRITKIRGEWIELEDPLLAGRQIMPIFHPSYLLRHEWNKAPDSPKAMMWKDIQEIKRVYDSLD